MEIPSNLSILDLYVIRKLATFMENSDLLDEFVPEFEELVQSGARFSQMFFQCPTRESERDKTRSLLNFHVPPERNIFWGINLLRFSLREPSPLACSHRALLLWISLQIDSKIQSPEFTDSAFMKIFALLLQAGVFLPLIYFSDYLYMYCISNFLFNFLLLFCWRFLVMYRD